MPDFEPMDGYADLPALRQQTAAIISMFDEVENRGKAMGDNLKKFTTVFDNKSTGTKELLDGIKKLELTSANYQKVLAAVGAEIDNLTESQKKQLKEINEQYKAEEQLRAGAKETVNLIKTEISQNEKLTAGRSELARTIAINNVELKRQNDLKKAEAQIAATEEGSIKRAEAVRARLLLIQKNINVTTDAGAQKSENYKKKIDELNNFINQNSDSLTKQKINIGNYVGSAKIIVDALEKERKKLEELEKTRTRVQNSGAAPISGFGRGNTTGPEATANTSSAAFTGISKGANDATIDIKELDAEIAKSRTIVEGFARVTDNPKFLNIAAKVGDANQEVRFFTKSLIDMEKNGLGNTQPAIELRKRLAELTDQIGDTKAEIKALSSDTRGFDLFAGSISFAADAFQTFAGAAVLAGASEEDAAEATKTLVAVQSVANGVKGIANELTTRGTAANKLYAFSQAQISTAMDSTASAGVRLRAILLTLGFGALIVGIGLLIANFSKIKDTVLGVTKAQKALNETQKAYNEAAGTAIKQVTDVRVAFDLAKKGVISKEDALKKYNDTLGDSFGKTNDLATAEKNLADKADAYIKITGLKAQANALFALSAEQTSRAVLASTEDQTSALDKVKSGILSYFGDAGGAQVLAVESQLKGVKSAVADATQQADLLKTKGEEILKQAGELANTSGIKVDLIDNKEDKPKKEKKSNDDALKKALDEENRKSKAINDLIAENANERIRISEAISDNEANQVGIRLNAEKVALEFKKSLALQEYTNAIASETKIENGKKIIVEKSNEEKVLAKARYENQLNKLISESGNKQVEIVKQNDQKILDQKLKDEELELDLLLEAKEKSQQQLEIDYNNELTALNTRFSLGKISQEEYNKKRQELDEAYQIAALQAEIKYTKKVLEIMKLRGVDVSDQLAALAKLEMDLSEMVKNRVIKNESDKEKKKREEKEKTIKTLSEIQEAYSSFADTVSSTLGAVFDFQTKRIQEQLSNIDLTRDAELKKNENIVQSEAEKNANIKIINERAQAQKEALERRQKQIEQQKAKAEKALSVFQIILSTAVNVAKAANPLMKALALVSGAAQLAIAIATPIPKFKDGLHHDYEGPGIVNDHPNINRKEVIIRKDGKLEFPTGRNVLTHFKKGDRVHSDAAEFQASLQQVAMNDIARSAMKAPITEENYAAQMTASMERHLGYQSKLLEQIADKEQLHLESSETGMIAIHKWGASQIKYVNEQTNWNN